MKITIIKDINSSKVTKPFQTLLVSFITERLKFKDILSTTLKVKTTYFCNTKFELKQRYSSSLRNGAIAANLFIFCKVNFPMGILSRR